MSWPLTIAVALAGLFVLDQILRQLERWGLIYYRTRRPSSSGVGNALAELQAMLSPASQHVVIAQKEPRAKRNADGDPPDDEDAGPQPPPRW